MPESAERPLRWRFGAPFEWALLALSIYGLVALRDQRWLAGATAIQATSSIGLVRAMSTKSLPERVRTQIAAAFFFVRWASGGAMLLIVLIQLVSQ